MDFFDLEGPTGNYYGVGSKDADLEVTDRFPLRQGVLVISISHEGKGKLELEFVGSEGSTKEGSTAKEIGGGAIAGAAIGSVIPVVGTIAGGLLGAAAGALGRGILGTNTWGTEDLEGVFDDFVYVIRVAEDSDADLKPGDYCLQVRSKAKWNCRFIQPNLGQAVGSITDDDEEESTDQLIEPGAYVAPPMFSGRRPVTATIKHAGAGDFSAFASSVDGTHQCEIYAEIGQFYVEDLQTEIRPGKEYVLVVDADGSWNMDFSEGY